jgi:hypothetical protein
VGRQVADGMAKPAKLLVPALYPELAKMRATGGRRGDAQAVAPNRSDRRRRRRVLLLISSLFGKSPLVLVMGKAFRVGRRGS